MTSPRCPGVGAGGWARVSACTQGTASTVPAAAAASSETRGAGWTPVILLELRGRSALPARADLVGSLPQGPGLLEGKAWGPCAEVKGARGGHADRSARCTLVPLQPRSRSQTGVRRHPRPPPALLCQPKSPRRARGRSRGAPADVGFTGPPWPRADPRPAVWVGTGWAPGRRVPQPSWPLAPAPLLVRLPGTAAGPGVGRRPGPWTADPRGPWELSWLWAEFARTARSRVAGRMSGQLLWPPSPRPYPQGPVAASAGETEQLETRDGFPAAPRVCRDVCFFNGAIIYDASAGVGAAGSKSTSD